MTAPLPALPPGDLVGRDDALSALLDCVERGERLITVTGPGGIGKTRLALALAHRLAGEGRTVAFAELVQVSDPAGLLDALADAVGIAAPDAGEGSIAELGRALAVQGELTLVLDDLDRLVTEAGPVMSRLLAISPETTFVLTSRQRLGVPDEAVVELGPLGLPSGDHDLETSAAVALFVREARRARAGFELTPADQPFVAELVRELDGNPLALSLAAGRMNVMAPRVLLHRLRQRSEPLSRSGGPARHASLEAAIETSWLALNAVEQEALGQLAVFRGGFDIAAAEAVVDLSHHDGAPPVAEVLVGLRDRSLLVAVPGAGDMRLSLYATVRGFVDGRVAPELRAQAEARHAAYHASLAEHLGRGAQARHALLAAREDMLAVVERVLGRGSVTARTAEPALRVVGALAPVLLTRGPLGRYAELLGPAVDATAHSGARPGLQGRALLFRGVLRRRQGDVQAATRDLVRAMGIGTGAADDALAAEAAHALGDLLLDAGDAAAAERHLEQAADLLRRTGDRLGEARVEASRARLLVATGRGEDALTLLERAVAAHGLAGDPVGEAAARRQLARLLMAMGSDAEAADQVEAATRLSAGSEDLHGEADAEGLAGLLSLVRGEPEEARQGLADAAHALAAVGFAHDAAVLDGLRGIAERLAGRSASAHALLVQAADRVGGGGDPEHLGLFLAHRAGLEIDAGRLDAAHQLLDELGDQELPGHVAAVVALERARIEAAEADLGAHGRHVHVRVAARCVQGARPTTPPPPDDALLVGEDGGWFRPPRGERVGIERRRNLSLLLDRLAEERLARPGRSLAWDELLAAGWPGERVMPESGAHRVRVALSTLRKLGLRDSLQTVEDGYRLDPAVDLVRA